MKLLLTLVLLLPIFIFAQNPQLAYPQTAFDSDTCCWRKLAAAEHYQEAGQLIVSYLKHSPQEINKHSACSSPGICI
ncbi:MAG: hypothetical protein V4581_17730 [Bacteroidota bacterium]